MRWINTILSSELQQPEQQLHYIIIVDDGYTRCIYSNNLTDWLSLLYIRGYVAIFPLIYQVGILLDVGNLYEACPNGNDYYVAIVLSSRV
jgi:hypothetical protein